MKLIDRLADSFFGYKWFTLRVRRDIADEIRTLVKKLIQEDIDGPAYRMATNHLIHFERPIMRSIIGNDTALQIEGPSLSIDGIHFYFGSQILACGRWAQLGPVETNELHEFVRLAIDRALVAWFQENLNTAKTSSKRRVRNRELDDIAAFAQMLAFADAAGQKAEVSDER